jgi:hypothetical protein
MTKTATTRRAQRHGRRRTGGAAQSNRLPSTAASSTSPRARAAGEPDPFGRDEHPQQAGVTARSRSRAASPACGTERRRGRAAHDRDATPARP